MTAAGNVTPGGAGIHPGQPIIWPSGKGSPQSQSVSQAQVAQTSGGVRGSAGAAVGPSGVTGTTVTGPGAPASPAQTAPAIARALTEADLKNHLVKIQIPDTTANVKLASIMLKYGMELSRGNFVNVLTMLEGTDKSMSTQEAAVLLSMKNIDSPKALDVLSNFIAQNPQLSAQLANVQQAMANLGTALGISQGLMDANLVGQLGALLTQFDSMVQDLGRKSQFTGDNSLGFKDLMNSLRGMKAILEGAQGQVKSGDSAESQMLQSSLMQTLRQLSSAMDNMIAQAILSQKGKSEEVNYLYEQIPNLSEGSKRDLEIVIKRDSNKESKDLVDRENTNVIISLGTENLGKMVCNIIIKGKRVYLVFVFDSKDYGDDARAIISKEFAALQKKMTEKNFVVSGYQVKVDPAMCSIKPYLIPLLPRLEEQLKKIDLEA
ncbi:MAG: hypothetical protein ABIB65_01980 [Candidatus Margulisiibacteriota bacterium]